MCRLKEVNGQDENLWNSCQNSSVDRFIRQTYLTFLNNKKIESHAEDITFHGLD